MTHLFLIIFFTFLAAFLVINLLGRYKIAQREKLAARQAAQWHLQRSAE